jgi:hypothetical protein
LFELGFEASGIVDAWIANFGAFGCDGRHAGETIMLNNPLVRPFVPRLFLQVAQYSERVFRLRADLRQGAARFVVSLSRHPEVRPQAASKDERSGLAAALPSRLGARKSGLPDLRIIFPISAKAEIGAPRTSG